MNYEERLKQAKALYAQAPKADDPLQKFPRGSFVTVCSDLPSSMRHFPKGFLGVIEYSYAQKYGGRDLNNYSIIMLDDKNLPINCISWYHQDFLTLVDGDIETGLKIIAAWVNFSK